ncbi:MAG: DUF1016 N-terminal domain-containing protein [Candidatus Omnitrophica bacterium]|nr:DUF1016 N-terminal domain-containing protein [Candidatus Omnitrophota bacterium]
MVKKLLKSIQLKVSLAGNYPALAARVKGELSSLEVLVKRETIKSYWNIGKFIHSHLLENKERAQYGNLLYERLSRDVGRDSSTLRRTVKFYLAYPRIQASRPELNWTQYKQLITIKDKDERKQLEEQFVKKGFDARKSQAFLNFKKTQLAAKDAPDKPVVQLSFARGKLLTYSFIESKESDVGLLLDLGFRIRRNFEELKGTKFVKGDCVRVLNKNSFVKADVKKEELFTYFATIEKIIDGDTLTVLLDLGMGLFVQQKLRLRGIDCPEMDTDDGVRAKKFVQTKLGKLDFIIVKTYKDSSDKYDRYLADIFYLVDERDPERVAQEGAYLNQVLLDERLACVY